MPNLIEIARVGPRTSSHSADEQQFSDKWLAKVDIRNADPWDVRTLLITGTPPPIPPTWPSVPAARLKGLSLSQQSANGRIWEASASYSTKADGSEEQPLDENPLNKPMKRSLRFQPADKVIDRDIYDQPIVNTVGDPFDDVTIVDAQWEINIAWNSPTFILDYYDQLKRATNSDHFMNRAPETLIVGGLEADEERATITDPVTQEQQTITYAACRATLLYEPKKWRKKIPSTGYRYLGPPDGVPQRILDADGNPKEALSFLSEDGQVLDIQGGDQPYYLEYVVYTPIAFGQFFPQS